MLLALRDHSARSPHGIEFRKFMIVTESKVEGSDKTSSSLILEDSTRIPPPPAAVVRFQTGRFVASEIAAIFVTGKHFLHSLRL